MRQLLAAGAGTEKRRSSVKSLAAACLRVGQKVLMRLLRDSGADVRFMSDLE